MERERGRVERGSEGGRERAREGGRERERERAAGLVKGHWDYRDQLPLLVHVIGLAKGAASPLPPSLQRVALPSGGGPS